MNISGIRPYAGFYDYNSIKSSELRSQQIQEAEAAKNNNVAAVAIEVEQNNQNGASSDNQKFDTDKRDFGAYDFAQLYRPEEEYELKGAESDIRSLDMEQAISDMQKDQVLQQYQFFVGENRDVLESPIRDLENFNI